MNVSMRVLNYFFALITVLLCLTLLSSPPASAADDTCTWTGSGGNSNFTNGSNWTGCDNSNVPQGGDTVVFPNGPTNKTVTVNTTIGVANMSFTGDNYTVNTPVPGDVVVVTNNINLSGNNSSIDAFIYFISSADTSLTVSGSGNEFLDILVLQPSSGGTHFTTNVSSSIDIPNISNASSTLIDSVIKTGEGTVVITGGTIVNGFESINGLDITAGTWRCEDDRCVGDAANDIVIEEGGTSAAAVLELNNASINIENPIFIASTSDDPGTIRATLNATVSGNVSLMTDGVFEAAASRTLTVSGGVSVDSGQTLHLNGSGNVVQSGVVSGSGGVTVVGNAQLTNTNSYSGATAINGVVTISDALALGSNAGSTTINDNGQLILIEDSTGYTLDEDITLQGDGPSGSGALLINNSHASDMILTGNIVMSDDGVITNSSTTGSVIIDTVISGTGDVTLSGNSGAVNDFSIDGPSANTYSGTMIINQGFVQFAKGGSVSGDLTVTAHASEDSGALHGSSVTNAISDTGTVTLTNNGAYVASIDLDGTETIGGLAGDGTIDESADTLALNGSGNYEFTGDITVDTITKSGSGTQIFNDVDAQTIDVTSGNLVIKGTTTAVLSFASGSTLKGTGPIGSASVAGTLAPGLSPGIMTVSGNLNLTNGTYQVELNGTTAGTGYDQSIVSGTTTLSGTTLSATLGFVPVTGTSFTIIRSATIAGTFNGLSDGATLTISGITMRVNYNLSASGEDTVTLTVLSVATAPSTGLGSAASPLLLISTGIVFLVISLAVILSDRRKARLLE